MMCPRVARRVMTDGGDPEDMGNQSTPGPAGSPVPESARPGGQSLRAEGPHGLMGYPAPANTIGTGLTPMDPGRAVMCPSATAKANSKQKQGKSRSNSESDFYLLDVKPSGKTEHLTLC